jgi:hypothetical protein
MKTRLLLAWLTLAMLLSLPARADDGHHHDAAPAAPTGQAPPRFAAVSEVFELVGIVDGKQLILYLDRFDNNAPVEKARIDLELGGAKLAVKETSPGEYKGALAGELQAGDLAVTATVVASGVTDILATDFHVDGHAHADGESPTGWRRVAAWGAGAVLVLAVLAVLGRRAMAARRARTGGTA